MHRNRELIYLIFVLIVVAFGLILAYLSFIDRGVASVLETVNGLMDISDYFLDPFPNAAYGLIFSTVFLLLHIFLRKKLPDADPFILPVIALLSGIGAIMILRLSPDLAYARNTAIVSILSRDPDASVTNNVHVLAQLGTNHFIHIITGALMMLISFYLFSRRFFSWLSSKKYLWVTVSVMLIAVTMLFGTTIHGRSLWLFGFQTVELVKLLTLFFISGYIYEKGKGINTYGEMNFRSWFSHAGPFVAMWFFALLPIFIQQDLGPTFLIFTVFLFMFHWAGNRKSVTLLFVLLILAAGYISYSYEYPSIVKTRFDILLDPFGKSESMSRALWSISSGGFFGAGIGFGRPYRIPVVQSDHNFSAICEEMGFVSGVGVILLYAVLVHRCLKIASCTDNLYKKSLVIGIGLLIGIQAFIIISGNLGIIPLMGITLPFVSYGGSSMIVTFFMAGIVLKISGNSKTISKSQIPGTKRI